MNENMDDASYLGGGGVAADSDGEAITAPDVEQQSLVSFVEARFNDAKLARLTHENRWLRAYKNYRGVYDSSTAYTENEESHVFVKITKTKVLAAYGQLTDVLFAGNKFPLSVEATEKPVGIAEAANINLSAPQSIMDAEPTEPEGPTDVLGYKGDGNDLQPGETLANRLGKWWTDKLKGTPHENKVEEGFGAGPQQIDIAPAERAARKMNKKIMDQLGETKAGTALRHAAFECVVFGTGIIKGPTTSRKIYNSWDENRTYSPILKDVPELQHTSIWNAYPDPSATCNDDMEYFIERHKLSRSRFMRLKSRPHFRADIIDALAAQSGNYTRQHWETDIHDADTTTMDPQHWEVLEYWGYIDKAMAEEEGLTLPDIYAEMDTVQVNVWVCGGQVIRMVLNPFQPMRIPYNIVPYEILPYQVWGIGIPENMEDSQTIMNGHARMAIDNLVRSGNVIFEVDETFLAPNEDLTMYPGKVVRKQGGQTGQSIFAHKFPNTTVENMMLFDRFRQFADEETGIPSFSHGNTGVNGMTRTSSGMSMLFNAAALNIKTVVKNFDDYMLRPLGEAMFAWNMQFDPDEEIVGDLEIKARGTSSLMQKEVRSQRLIMLMQVGANPQLAPHIKWPTVLREYAETLEIDPDKFINNADEAKFQASLTQGMNNGQGPGAPSLGGPQSPGGQGGVPGMGAGEPGNAAASRGNGNIDGGSVAMPGEAGFSAGGGEAPRLSV